MLTPQEVSERAFQKASFGGYNMGQVDEFLDILTADYTGLYNENAVLKSKMKVLVDKVEEYRATEDAMRKALMTAQRMADDLIHEAEEKKEQLTRGIINLAVGAVILIVLVVLAIKYRSKIPTWWKGLKSECGKITWCPKDKLKKNVIVVVIIILAIAIAIGVLDFVFSRGMILLGDLFH